MLTLYCTFQYKIKWEKIRIDYSIAFTKIHRKSFSLSNTNLIQKTETHNLEYTLGLLFFDKITE